MGGPSHIADTMRMTLRFNLQEGKLWLFYIRRGRGFLMPAFTSKGSGSILAMTIRLHCTHFMAVQLATILVSSIFILTENR